MQRALPGAPTYTYMSVKNPEALNLDGSIYGIAVRGVPRGLRPFSLFTNFVPPPLPLTTGVPQLHIQGKLDV